MYVMAVVRTYLTCRNSVMCTNEDSQSQREDQVQKGRKRQREREELLFHFSHEQALQTHRHRSTAVVSTRFRFIGYPDSPNAMLMTIPPTRVTGTERNLWVQTTPREVTLMTVNLGSFHHLCSDSLLILPDDNLVLVNSSDHLRGDGTIQHLLGVSECSSRLFDNLVYEYKRVLGQAFSIEVLSLKI